MPPKFLYFDLGRVMVNFDVGRMCRQMGEAAGTDPVSVRDALFNTGLQRQYELGLISTAEFHEAFCTHTGTRADRDALIHAGSDIFELNLTILPVVAQLNETGHRLGVLSNTCISHWEHCRRRYRILAEAFEVHVLSYEVRAGKPDAVIFDVAAQKAGVSPSEIFFTDDVPDNVAGARTAGFDAVPYTSTHQLVAALRDRGLRFNY